MAQSVEEDDSLQNPFAGAGREVTGERFVGRTRELESLLGRPFSGCGNVSVVGMPRVGKTSLVAEAIRRHNQGTQPLLVVRLNLGAVSSSRALYVNVIDELVMHHESRLPTQFREATSQDQGDADAAYRLLQRVLKTLARLGHATVIVLDEFDAIRSDAFDRPEVVIQQLREILYAPAKFGAHGVLISRRPLSAIENQTQNSVLSGICETLNLKPFCPQELIAMTDRVKQLGPDWQIDASLLQSWTGGHPYLAELFLGHQIDNGRGNEVPPELATRCFEHYMHLERILTEDSMFDQLLQLAVGPRWSLRPGSPERLRAYGLVRQLHLEGRQRFVGWSDHFQLYLELRARTSEFLPLWHATEQDVRQLIADLCERNLGGNWLMNLRQRHAKQLERPMALAHSVMVREQAAFGDHIHSTLLDYLYPMDLWTIMSQEWAVFGPALGQNRQYWQTRFETMSIVRNPAAHSRQESIPQHLVTQAMGYCEELRAQVGLYFRRET
jgi:hypothetical protein